MGTDGGLHSLCQVWLYTSWTTGAASFNSLTPGPTWTLALPVLGTFLVTGQSGTHWVLLQGDLPLTSNFYETVFMALGVHSRNPLMPPFTCPTLTPLGLRKLME